MWRTGGRLGLGPGRLDAGWLAAIVTAGAASDHPQDTERGCAMGERTTGLNQAPRSLDEMVEPTNGAGRVAESPRETVRQLEGQITMVRDELGELVAELDRRRHEALDVKLQVRRHAPEITLTSVALIGAAAGLVWLNVWRGRRRQRLSARAGRLQQAMSRMIERPERVAAEPTVAMKIFAAAASTAAPTLIRKVLERVVQQAMDRRQLAAIDTSPACPVQPKPRSAA
jgi:hypothetical protein